MEKICKAAVFVFIIYAIAYVLTGCSSSKHVATSSEEVTSTSAINVDSLVRRKIDSTASHYEQKIKQLDNTIQFGENCNDDTLNSIIRKLRSALTDSTYRVQSLMAAIAQLESLPKQPGKIIYKSSGSFEAIGLKFANLKLLQSQVAIDSMRSALEEEVNLRIVAGDSLSIIKNTKTVDKEKKFFDKWWIWFLLGAIAMLIAIIWLNTIYKPKN